jgi:hypothetical protein
METRGTGRPDDTSQRIWDRFLSFLGFTVPDVRRAAAEPRAGGEMMPVSDEQMDRLRRVKMTHERELMKKKNVVGVGIGLRERGGERTDEPVIVVSVTRKVPPSMLDLEDTIPQELEGVPVDVQAIGEPRALDEHGG